MKSQIVKFYYVLILILMEVPQWVFYFATETTLGYVS